MDVYNFWFRGKRIRDWFGPGARRYDKTIRSRFSSVLKSASKGRLRSWSNTRKGFVALVIVLDQFTRQIYRGSQKAFLNDKKALNLVRSLPQATLRKMLPREQMFIMLPYQHSESINVQQQGLRRIKDLVHHNPKSYYLRLTLKHHLGHMKVIQRFGRFPKRVPRSERTAEEQSYIRSSSAVAY